MKRILITGAAGFLGSHLCDRFIAEGYYVIGMDNLITGDLKNIEHLFKHPHFEFYHHDITKFVHIPGQLDYILHFASPASPIDYLKIPIQTLKVGSLGTHNLLGLARNKKARILIASTSEVYGDPLVHPQPETYWGNVNPVGFRGVYDEAKRFAEAMTMAYHRFHGVLNPSPRGLSISIRLSGIYKGIFILSFSKPSRVTPMRILVMVNCFIERSLENLHTSPTKNSCPFEFSSFMESPIQLVSQVRAVWHTSNMHHRQAV